ncbi:peptidoglycan-binding domain-containing protein [Gemmobacter sp. 24YEA27]|uniref:peptidoglycan recognition protein family protein n=1 Tax=Gemmobacter sp. 24YEA27 TaxID=3040672 RepID=UPI0024B35B8B|nr:peptidoglycan-binding domain-containing protein [Gemmobacter sp. 24YEA27]
MMNRIIGHHTGGAYFPNATDLVAYHRLIDGDGQPHDGKHPISANAPGRALTAGTYAAHCLNLNSGSIGVSICAMANADWGKPASWTHPVKPAQVDAFVQEMARLCRIYGIPVTRRTVLSHAEVEITLGVKQKNKWDFDYPLRGTGPRDPIAIGDELRREVGIALLGQPVPPPSPSARPILRQGATGPDVREVQAALGVVADGIFGPRTRAALIDFQSRRQLLPDGICGAMTWAAISTMAKGA